MKIFCLILVFSGAGILFASMVLYYKVLQYMKNQNYDERTFNNWIYGASFALMIFFFIGYIGVGIRSLTSIQPDQFLIALIFFFGSIFVFCMVKVQQTMTITITRKTTETLQSMVDAMEAKDLYTKGHSEHVLFLVELLYQQLPVLTKQRINLNKLKDAAMLHDIGKIGIPDVILNKPGKLTDEEYSIIKQHPKNGAAILEKTSYREICNWIKYHHERMDGKGYYRLPADEIPLEARIIAVADTFSALSTDRVYRERFSYEKALTILKECAGEQLDPWLVNIFCSISKEAIKKTMIVNVQYE